MLSASSLWCLFGSSILSLSYLVRLVCPVRLVYLVHQVLLDYLVRLVFILCVLHLVCLAHYLVCLVYGAPVVSFVFSIQVEGCCQGCQG